MLENELSIHLICYILGDPNNPYKEERERIFFSYDDKISMSIEYYDPEADSNKAPVSYTHLRAHET